MCNNVCLPRQSPRIQELQHHAQQLPTLLYTTNPNQPTTLKISTKTDKNEPPEPPSLSRTLPSSMNKNQKYNNQQKDSLLSQNKENIPPLNSKLLDNTKRVNSANTNTLLE